MLMLVAGTAASITSPPARVQVRSKATIRIERPAIVSRKEWEDLPKSARREIIVRDERGDAIVVRVIEFQ